MHKLHLLRSNCLFHDVGKGFNSDMQALEASVCRLESSIVLSTDQSFKGHFLLLVVCFLVWPLGFFLVCFLCLFAVFFLDISGTSSYGFGTTCTGS